MSRSTDLPPYDRVVSSLVRAEQAEGWLARCHDAGRYVVPTEELVDALAGLLGQLGQGPVVEVCAGAGALARGLRSRGVAVVATDVRPSDRRPWEVRTMAADEALEKYRPRVVLGSFVPVDADVDRRVLSAPHVHHYVVLNARIGQDLGSRSLWEQPGWSRTLLSDVSRWLVTRHDAWLGEHLPILRHGEAWLLSRASRTGAGAEPPVEECAP